MVKILLHSFGSVIYIGMESDSREEIELRFNSFWNFGATSAEAMEWATESLAYFWTTPEKLAKYYETSSLHKILNEFPNKFRGQKKGAMIAARQLAEERIKEIIPEFFLYKNEGNFDWFTSGKSEKSPAEKNYDDFFTIESLCDTLDKAS